MNSLTSPNHLTKLFILGCLFALSIGLYADDTQQWRTLSPENTVYLDTPDGRIVIELNPTFAPKTVAQFKRLIRDSFYQNSRFYRVIDGFVAQGGDGSDLNRELTQPTLVAEFERSYSTELGFVSAQSGDLFAAETGFINGFPVARDQAAKTTWLTHCPGTVAMARDNDPASGSSDFYIVIGQAPRYLDRNLTIFGRVVAGMDIVQRIKRGPKDNNGIITESAEQTPFTQIKVAADLTDNERSAISVINTNHSVFKQQLDSRRNRTHEFFHYKPPHVLDVCQVPIPTK